jgi:hypothetical protein
VPGLLKSRDRRSRCDSAEDKTGRSRAEEVRLDEVALIVIRRLPIRPRPGAERLGPSFYVVAGGNVGLFLLRRGRPCRLTKASSDVVRAPAG